MKKINFGFLALALALAVSVAQAGTVSMEGPGVGQQAPGTTSGTFNIVFDLESIDNFQNGGIVLGLSNSDPSVIQFTDATVLNPGGRWTIAADTSSAVGIEFTAFSVQSPALPTGGQDVIFATVNWTSPSSSGITELGWIVGEEALVDGRNFGTIVNENYQFLPNFVSFVPEPTSLAMAGLSLFGLVLRRRND